MTKSCIFFRLIDDLEKANSLKNNLDSIQSRLPKPDVYIKNLRIFMEIPGSPFAYWVSKNLRESFKKILPFEIEGRTVRVGLQTSEDNKFLRIWWEVSPEKILSGTSTTTREEYIQQTFKNKKWVLFAKGGDYSPFYADIFLVVNWKNNGDEICVFQKSVVRNPEFYFAPGLTWTHRTTSQISFRILNAGTIFGHKGPSAFLDNPLKNLAIFQSSVNIFFVNLLVGAAGAAARSYDVGIIQRVPFPKIHENDFTNLTHHVNLCIDTKRSLDTTREISHIFCFPIFFRNREINLIDSIKRWIDEVKQSENIINISQTAINSQIYQIYTISSDDQRLIEKHVNNKISPVGDTEVDSYSLVESLISYLIGCIFGRWDVRYVIGKKKTPELPDPFAPLPACSPGMLQGDDGLPLIESPLGYPLNIQWNGILVDDAGHIDDIVQRVRDVFYIIYNENAESIEAESCSFLGVSSLADYFKRPAAKGFFDDHIKKYSKSRRKAPIYWKLSSSKGSYSIWIYYHRITSDTLFQILKYVDDKINLEISAFDGLKIKKESEKDTIPRSQLTKLGKEIEAKSDFINELKDFREKINKVAQRGYDPDLDDGVILNMAPLYEVIPWKEPKTYWVDLEKGKYDWAHIAMKYWPERVKEKCRKDKSIAIAHDLEHLYEAD